MASSRRKRSQQRSAIAAIFHPSEADTPASPSTSAAEAEAAASSASAEWTKDYPYRNSDTGRLFEFHKGAEEEESAWLGDDKTKYLIALGGEGGGKSVIGIMKDLEKLRLGCSGALVSPDFEHFKKSLWKEFRRWCPWDFVVESQRHRKSPEWTPQGPFDLVFNVPGGGYATLTCGGIKEPGTWEGPNLNFFHFDEARHAPDAGAIKVLSGRIRMPGPRGEPPQGWITTTPKVNWLYDYFGPLQEDDEFAEFKASSRVIHMDARRNAPNLAPGYIEDRSKTLTAAEIRVYVGGEWEDVDTGQRFLESMVWWDACREQIPPLGRDPLVIAIDAGIASDSFGLVAVSRHGAPARHDHIAVRYVREWTPPRGGKIVFENGTDGPLDVVRWLCRNHNVICIAYDPYQLHSDATRLQQEGVSWLYEFSQGAQRLEADKALLDMILARQVAHDGSDALRRHVDNADRKLDIESRKLRIVKRSEHKKIDLAVCLSMAAYQCRSLNL